MASRSSALLSGYWKPWVGDIQNQYGGMDARIVATITNLIVGNIRKFVKRRSRNKGHNEKDGLSSPKRVAALM